MSTCSYWRWGKGITIARTEQERESKRRGNLSSGPRGMLIVKHFEATLGQWLLLKPDGC